VLVGVRDGTSFADATIKLDVRGEIVHTTAEGLGPVNAIDSALRKALVPLFPEIARVRLEDYKVRILDGCDGTSAAVRVLIEHGDGDRRWTTVGASRNIIEASWQAIADGVEYGFLARARTEAA
jgi:2-isopropylmalate synthase